MNSHGITNNMYCICYSYSKLKISHQNSTMIKHFVKMHKMTFVGLNPTPTGGGGVSNFAPHPPREIAPTWKNSQPSLPPPLKVWNFMNIGTYCRILTPPPFPKLGTVLWTWELCENSWPPILKDFPSGNFARREKLWSPLRSKGGTKLPLFSVINAINNFIEGVMLGLWTFECKHDWPLEGELW